LNYQCAIDNTVGLSCMLLRFFNSALIIQYSSCAEEDEGLQGR